MLFNKKTKLLICGLAIIMCSGGIVANKYIKNKSVNNEISSTNLASDKCKTSIKDDKIKSDVKNENVKHDIDKKDKKDDKVYENSKKDKDVDKQQSVKNKSNSTKGTSSKPIEDKNIKKLKFFEPNHKLDGYNEYIENVQNNLTKNVMLQDNEIIDLFYNANKMNIAITCHPAMTDEAYEYKFADDNFRAEYVKVKEKYNNINKIKSYLTKVFSEKNANYVLNESFKVYKGNCYLKLGNTGYFGKYNVESKVKNGNLIKVVLKSNDKEYAKVKLNFVYQNGKWVIDNMKL